MLKDIEYIIQSSAVDEEFRYVEDMSESQTHQPDEDFLTLEEASQQIEAQDDAMEKVDPFGEPQCYRTPEPKTASWSNQDAKIDEETTDRPRISTSFNSGSQLAQPTLSFSAKLQVKPSDSYQPPVASLSLGAPKPLPKGSKSSKSSKIKKSKKPKRDQYPTKNFLPSFRSSFLSYIGKRIGEEYFQTFQIVRRIRSKPCINLQDYSDLFNEEQFRPILEVYFRDNVIVRDLMQSRIEFSTKCEYFKRIHVFEEAFRARAFLKINY